MNRLLARREPFSRGEKLLVACLPLGIAGFIVSGLWLRRGEAVPQITFPTPAALPVPNGFDFYVAAATAVRASNPAVDPIDDRKPLLTTNPKLAAQNYSLARRTAWLGANQAGFALFKQGTRTPSRYPTAMGFANFAPLRQLARSKVIEANTFVLQGRWNDATKSSLDAIQMGNDIARGGPLIAKLVGSGITAIGRDPLFTAQFVPERLTAAQARAAARRLEAILASRPSWKDALAEEKWAILSEFMSIVQRGNWRALAAQNGAQTTWRDRFANQFLSASEVSQHIVQNCDRNVENVQKPYKIAVTPLTPLDPVSANLVFNQDYRFNEGREIVPFNVLLLRFALRAYRLENGNFPEKLEQLVPKYLKGIPTDYFASGAPFRFRKKGADYELWSVGPDKIDNGGVPMKYRPGTVASSVPGRLPPINEDVTGDYVARKNR